MSEQGERSSSLLGVATILHSERHPCTGAPSFVSPRLSSSFVPYPGAPSFLSARVAGAVDACAKQRSGRRHVDVARMRRSSSSSLSTAKGHDSLRGSSSSLSIAEGLPGGTLSVGAPT